MSLLTHRVSVSTSDVVKSMNVFLTLVGFAGHLMLCRVVKPSSQSYYLLRFTIKRTVICDSIFFLRRKFISIQSYRHDDLKPSCWRLSSTDTWNKTIYDSLTRGFSGVFTYEGCCHTLIERGYKFWMHNSWKKYKHFLLKNWNE